MAQLDDYVRITARLPEDLHEQLKKASDESHRSVNSELVARLQFTFANSPKYLEARRKGLSVKEPKSASYARSIDADRLASVSKLIRAYVKEEGGEFSEDRLSELIAKAYDAINADGSTDLKKLVTLVENEVQKDPPTPSKKKTAKA